MADTVTTPAATESPTQEQLQQEYETHRAKVASIVPELIVDRLVRVHGFTIDSETEANAAVKAAIELFHMKQDGLVNLDEATTAESDSPLMKAAKSVSAVADKLRNQQASDERIYQAIFNDEDLLKSAKEAVRLLS